jgi:hypothetical protein
MPRSGPAEFAGVPIPDSLVEQWRANVSLEPVIVHDDGVPIAFGKRCTVLSPKILRAVLLRDHHCRICGSTRGLQVHHLRPRTWGGTDDISGLALVCSRVIGRSSRTGAGRWSATPTCPTAGGASISTI